MVLFDELRENFPELVSPQPPLPAAHNQVSIALRGPDVREIAAYLISAYESRLVAVFAEDRVAAEGVFYNYYVLDRKSTRLNSSHLGISYAVFCLKKKKKTKD